MEVKVLIAWDEDGQMRECVVVTSDPLAQEIYDRLRTIWGGANVAMASRIVDEVPQNILDAMVVIPETPMPRGMMGGGRHG